MHMALETRPWTRADLDRLPDDGNRYEVLNGELLVTPPPSEGHQEIVHWLNAQLTPFLVTYRLGRVQFPRSVVIIDEEQVEPDMMVRPFAPLRGWANAPTPLLVVEVLSKSTRRRDLKTKRDFYLRSGVGEYWVVDRAARTLIRITPTGSETVTETLTWAPRGTPATLEIDVAAMFREISR
jgi:Uma2 family endonuclease